METAAEEITQGNKRKSVMKASDNVKSAKKAHSDTWVGFPQCKSWLDRNSVLACGFLSPDFSGTDLGNNYKIAKRKMNEVMMNKKRMGGEEEKETVRKPSGTGNREGKQHVAFQPGLKPTSSARHFSFRSWM